MSNLVLELEVQPGTSIDAAAYEAAAVANRLKLNVRLDFNGINCFVVSGWTGDMVVSNYRRAIKLAGYKR